MPRTKSAKRRSQGKKNEWAKSVKYAYNKLKREGVIKEGEFVAMKKTGPKSSKNRQFYEAARQHYDNRR